MFISLLNNEKISYKYASTMDVLISITIQNIRTGTTYCHSRSRKIFPDLKRCHNILSCQKGFQKEILSTVSIMSVRQPCN